MATTYAIFDVAERLELLSAEIYRALAVRDELDEGSRGLFQRLALEEEQHASRIRLLRARYLHDSGLVERLRLPASALEPLLAEGEGVLESIRRGGWSADLAVVKQELADLEVRFSVAHAHVLAATADPGLRSFFEMLARQDAEHHRLLTGAGDPP